MNIIDNYLKLQNEIMKKALEIGRDPEHIQIVSVCKTFPAKIIQQAIDCGIKLFGENRVQETKAKIHELKGDFIFHLIGHLQSNKARDAVSIFDTIHSIDKFTTAEVVDKEAKKINKIQKILLQVNTTREDTKSGIIIDEALDLCKKILDLNNIQLIGFMTIGPFNNNSENIRDSFRILKELRNEINYKLGVNIHELSMGMSSDYLIAIEEGATILRIGSLIFGARSY